MSCQAISLLRLFFAFPRRRSAISCAPNHTSMAKSSPPPAGPGFTLIELLVVIVTISIMAAFAVPVFNGVLERARVTKDLSNLRQIGSATQMYMNDNNGVFPGSATVTWMSQLNQKYLSA